MRRLNFTEFCELLLARLYELDRDERPGADFDVRGIVEELRQEIPYIWARDAAIALGDQGLITPLRVGGGGVYASMTGAGRIFVEQQEGSQDSVVHEYMAHPTYFVNVTVSGDSNQLAVANIGATSQLGSAEPVIRDALELLRRVETLLQEDTTAGDHHMADVQAAREQLAREHPNRQAAAAIISSLSSVASVADLVEKFVHLLTP